MNKRSTPSGDGRGRSRDGNPRGGGGRPDRSSFRADRDGSRGGYGKQDSRGYGRPGAFRGRDGGSTGSTGSRPFRDGGSSGSRDGGSRPFREGGSSGSRDFREGGSRPFREGGSRDFRDSRDGGSRPSGDRYGRPDSRDGRSQGGGFPRRDRDGYGRPESRDRPYPRSGDDRGGYARDDRGGYSRDDRGSLRDDRGTGYSRDDRAYGSSREDRGDSRGSFGRSDDRGSSRPAGGTRARYGRPEGDRGSRGYAPRSDSRPGRDGYDRSEGRSAARSEGRDGVRSPGRDGGSSYGRDGGSGSGRDRASGYSRDGGSGYGRDGSTGSERRPARDDSRGFERRPERDGSRGFDRDSRGSAPRGDHGDRGDRGGFRGDRGDRGDRGGSRRDDVQTLGGGRGRFGRDSSRSAFRAGARGARDQAPRKQATPENPFKSARQPLRDPDFYDRDYVDERDTTEVPGGERLQKVLAQAGVASRRACEELIGEGRVTVDGQVVRRFGARVDPAKQIIHVDGKRIPTAPDLVYYALNKPIGVVSTMEDPEGRPCLRDYVQELAPRLFHVGRLDTETEGLLLLTNDGELAHRLTHPSFGVQKKYWAKVPGPVSRDLHRVLRKGIELEDGLAKVDEFHIVQEHGQQALVEVVLHEGRKHIVRRLLEESGHRVIDLARIEFGPVKLGRLKPGTVRALSLQEVGELYAAVKL
ncbi:hypothetical protein Aph01nite_77460 [Acrocarpospora phusangensis]|uniref:Pseudouridine synthase n=1 Tax=Acrocarpospora phusangensis TaxID=1070424 RepID=A0A919QKG5_9ACTN|nr:pseudouridine synthase [Acrocarpospora phusangensis]GIH29436.1 hypothetical protein Aph01nite_77460 [Acrocarpospora phusangensis]